MMLSIALNNKYSGNAGNASHMYYAWDMYKSKDSKFAVNRCRIHELVTGRCRGSGLMNHDKTDHYQERSGP